MLVIKGRGYDVHDGTRWDWETGDLVSIPAMAEHQHFNADPDHPVLLLSSMPSAGVALGTRRHRTIGGRAGICGCAARDKVSEEWRRKIAKADEGSQAGITAEHYYDYEARFVKQKREQERINILPRVIKPAMFAKGEFALGDMRVFSRYTVAPLSMLTCGFIEPASRRADRATAHAAVADRLYYRGERRVRSGGRQDSFRDRRRGYHSAVHDVSIYRDMRNEGFRAWLPQMRLWHGQGLLWRDPMANGEKRNRVGVRPKDSGALSIAAAGSHYAAPAKLVTIGFYPGLPTKIESSEKIRA